MTSNRRGGDRQNFVILFITTRRRNSELYRDWRTADRSFSTAAPRERRAYGVRASRSGPDATFQQRSRGIYGRRRTTLSTPISFLTAITISSTSLIRME